MNALLNIYLITWMFASTSGLFIAPSIYSTPPAKKQVCFNQDISDSKELPFLECANEGLLKIHKCTLGLATPETCPLLFSGANFNNDLTECSSPKFLVRTDCTESLTNLCKSKTKCVFDWNELPNLQCIDNTATVAAQIAVFIGNVDQQFTVEYKCENKRDSFRPFSNKRYSHKFSPSLANPYRRISNNRLARL